MNAPLVDSHCHLNYPPLDADTDGALERMAEQGVTRALAIATELESHDSLVGLASEHPQIFCTVGIHPNHMGGPVPSASRIAELAASHERVVAIGETGLDYFRGRDDAKAQSESLSAHVEAARTARKPLVIHTRDSFDDTLDQLRAEGAGEVGGVMHCFTGEWGQARRALDLGFLVSFTGIVTFNNAATVRETAAKVPADMYMVETDSPYLAPVPHRGKANEPAHVRLVAEKCAEVRGSTLEQVAEETTANFERLFGVSAR